MASSVTMSVYRVLAVLPSSPSKSMAQLENIQDDSRHGGARKGAGRKAGSATKRTREIADKAAENGITPLEFMLDVMRQEPGLDLEPRDALAAVALRFEAATDVDGIEVKQAADGAPILVGVSRKDEILRT